MAYNTEEEDPRRAALILLNYSWHVAVSLLFFEVLLNRTMRFFEVLLNKLRAVDNLWLSEALESVGERFSPRQLGVHEYSRP